MSEPLKGINADHLTAWFESHIEGARGPFDFSLIAGGHSNLTYRVEDSARHTFVLRRPPTGAVIATAHDMAREHRIIAALADTNVPVPPALGLCEDTEVNDAPFYVMAFVEGNVLVDSRDVVEHYDEGQRRRLGEHVVEVLANLHTIDPADVGLGDLGRREAYLTRQLKRWRTQWEKTQTRELPEMEEAYEGLLAQMPEQVGSGIVHGDYRLGNMLSSNEAKVAAVLDWELCTLGDPLADVGYIMNNWTESGEIDLAARGATQTPTAAGGFPTRAEFLSRYEELTGRQTHSIDYYRAFQYWRLAAIVEGVLSRYIKGVMGQKIDPSPFRAQVDNLAKSAVDLLRKL